MKEFDMSAEVFTRKTVEETKTFVEFCCSHTCNVWGEGESSCPLIKHQQPNRKGTTGRALERVNLQCEKTYNKIKEEKE